MHAPAASRRRCTIGDAKIEGWDDGQVARRRSTAAGYPAKADPAKINWFDGRC